METASKISKFFEQYDSHFYLQGSPIIDAGVHPEYIYYIKSGRVRMYDLSASGCKLTLNVLSVGAFFGLPWIYNRPNNYYFEALTDCEIIKCKVSKVKDFIDSNPDVIEDILIRLPLDLMASFNV